MSKLANSSQISCEYRGDTRPPHERGVVLIVALIALVIIALAAVALIRSSDTSSVISGNLAFKEATTHAADTGVERAFNALPALTAADVDVPNQYFTLLQATDATGVPSTINWANVPCYGTASAGATICTDESAYRVQYVVDRLCSAAPAKTDSVTTLTGKCVAGQPFSAGGGTGADVNSHTPTGTNYGSGPLPSNPPTIHYRVTVRVQGPRNNYSIVQATIELPYF